MKFLLLFSCIFVLCLAKIEPDLGLEETGKDLSPEIDDFSSENEDFLSENEEFSTDAEDELEDSIDDDDDEEDDFPNARIAHGKKAKRYAIPYHVAITANRGGVVTECCGALVTPNRILTVQGCVAEGVTSATLSLGVRNINNEGERGRVTLVLTDTNQSTVGRIVNGGTTYPGFSLIRLVNPIPRSRRIQPVQLPIAGTTGTSYVGYWMKIAGFGRYRRHTRARRIRFAESRLRPVTECGSALLSTTNVCFSGRKGRAACANDLGCPITTKFRFKGTTLIALVSLPATDCGGHRPRENTIGLRVVNALPFIAT